MKLQRSHSAIYNERESEAQLETNVTTKRQLTRMLGNRSDKPGLAHTGDHTGDTEAERNGRGNTDGQLIGLVVDLRTVAAEAALENEVIGRSDTGVNGQPVGNEVHEVLEDGLEVGVAGDGDGEGDAGGEESPNETGHALRVAAQDLQGQGDGVDVGAVVGDNGESQNDQAELAETTQRLEDGTDQTAVTGFGITKGVLVVSIVEGGCGHHGDAQELSEEQGDDETDPGREEDLAAAAVGGLVDCVVGRVTGPAGGEAVHGRAKGETIAQLGGTGAHGNVDKVARVGEGAQHDEEDDEGGDPAILLIFVDNFVTGEGDEEGAEGDDQDTGETRDGTVDSVQ